MPITPQHRAVSLTEQIASMKSAVANAARWKKPLSEQLILRRDLGVLRLMAAIEDQLGSRIPPTPEQLEEIYKLLDAYAGVDPATRDERRCQQQKKSAA